jgi:cytochrome c oxidase assembly protein subunit 15
MKTTENSPIFVTNHKAVALWLLACAALIFAMVVVGGVTRLTRSGLSIVEWKPITGVIPPVTQAEWNVEFERYQQFPEYQKVNRGMSLAEFKNIFLVEWAHRLLGRLTGLVFFLPLLYFALRRKIERTLIPKLSLIFALGGLQGLVGWLMVSSGLVDMPRVSAYWLTGHLLFAVLLFGLIVWLALNMLSSERRSGSAGALPRLRKLVIAAIAVMIGSGGFVAGIRAGYAFNTWPLMHGRLIPEGVWVLSPGWTNLFENIQTVQLLHRWLAIAVLALVGVFWWRVSRVESKPAGIWAQLLLLAAIVQVSLGIATLLYVVPVPLAAAHQAGALVLFTLALVVAHRLRGCRVGTL